MEPPPEAPGTGPPPEAPGTGPPPEAPGATYRLQLRPGFGFEAVRRLVPYLRKLGITHVYLSPILAARRGSTHGYDAVDPSRLNPELGSAAEFEALAEDLRAAGMSLLLDVVPNHMAASAGNLWWTDVLRAGQASPFARYFDIDWEAGGGKVVLPVLAEPLDDAIESGLLSLSEEGGERVLLYRDLVLPLAKGIPGRVSVAAALRLQHYQLVPWREAGRAVNYRRFFDINDLVSLRAEEGEVFDATHSLVLQVVRRVPGTGVRVDHVDGLLDPGAYLARLHDRLAAAAGPTPYVVVEKILARGEAIPREWPVAGATGYEFADAVLDLFLDPKGLVAVERAHERVAGRQPAFDRLAAQAKEDVLRTLFPGEVDRLAAVAEDLARREGGADAPAPPRLAEAVRALTAWLPVYRTYATANGLRSADRETIERAVEAALRDADPEARPAIRFLRRVLMLEGGPGLRAERLEFLLRWQRLTGPATAKGIEDTALYRWGGLLARAEVGGAPGTPPRTVEEFHAAMKVRRRGRPRSLSATSTHDTKRSEDVRARLAVLTEIPELWASRIEEWRRLNRPLRRTIYGREAPSPGEELHLYQTLVGAWPLDPGEEEAFRGRVAEYVLKAAREAKVHTSWLDPDDRYEGALVSFVRDLLAPENATFLGQVRSFVDSIAFAGVVNSLAMALVKATAPGVPDLYQGTELWSWALVDPDNRRPVDFDRRIELLERLRGMPPSARSSAGLLEGWRDGAVKLHVIHRALDARRRSPELFERGEYFPLEVRGRRRRHAVAFARRLGRRWSLTIVPRLVAEMTGETRSPIGPAWAGTTVAVPDEVARRLVDALRGEPITCARDALRLEEVFALLPLALLVPE